MIGIHKAYGHDGEGKLVSYFCNDMLDPAHLSHSEWTLRLAQSRGDAMAEDVAWTVDWKYRDSDWRLGVGGWDLETALKHYTTLTGAYEHRVRNMITNEVIPMDLL